MKHSDYPKTGAKATAETLSAKGAPSKSESEPSANRWRKPVVAGARMVPFPAAAASAPCGALAAAAGTILLASLTTG